MKSQELKIIIKQKSNELNDLIKQLEHLQYEENIDTFNKILGKYYKRNLKENYFGNEDIVNIDVYKFINVKTIIDGNSAFIYAYHISIFKDDDDKIINYKIESTYEIYLTKEEYNDGTFSYSDSIGEFVEITQDEFNTYKDEFFKYINTVRKMIVNHLSLH